MKPKLCFLDLSPTIISTGCCLETKNIESGGKIFEVTDEITIKLRIKHYEHQDGRSVILG